MAFSILSLGMFAARAFWIMRRRAGLLSGLGPPAFTAMAMSLPMRVNAFAILSHRLNMVALRVSKMRPMANALPHRARCAPPDLAAAQAGGHLAHDDQREERRLRDHELELLVVDRGELAVGPGAGRRAPGAGVDQRELTEEPIRADRLDDLVALEDVDATGLDDVHAIGRLARCEDHLARAKRLRRHLLLEDVRQLHCGLLRVNRSAMISAWRSRARGGGGSSSAAASSTGTTGSRATNQAMGQFGTGRPSAGRRWSASSPRTSAGG